MDSSLDNVKDQQLKHFSHHHPLSLVHLQQLNHKNENDDADSDDEEEDKKTFVEEEHHGGQCNMCKEQIWSFHLCYYKCMSCDYSLHKFCAKLPETQQNHPLHPNHFLSLCYIYRDRVRCFVCKLMPKNVYFYQCYECYEYMDIVCATMSEHKINHPSHPHQLQRMSWPIVSSCVACGNKHEGVFFHCTTCPEFWINLECTLLPAKLLIQNHTDGNFTHSHPLTLAYSFSHSEMQAKSFPHCRVCDRQFKFNLWIYKCDKCQYYVHVDCATSKRDSFMSIFLPAWLGKTHKNYKEEDHPHLLHCPFEDEGENLLKRHMTNHKQMIGEQHDGEMLVHASHQHPLVLFDKETLDSNKTITLHNPMKRIQLLCDGCVKPIMTVPFYMCCKYVNGQCCFVLHEWCAKLPSYVQDYVGHPEHTLFLMPKIPKKFFGVFKCKICRLPSNGFAYGCTMCEFYVDVNCAFIPKEITHDAHSDHILSIIKPSITNSMYCIACHFYSTSWGFHCPFCDIYIHVECALLLPKVIKHKCDKHPLSLRYEPVENHPSDYFCEICEDELIPLMWFYHCTACAQSMHVTCVPLILQYELATDFPDDWRHVYKFLNVKFGGTLEIKGHSHRLSFVQGLESDGDCSKCQHILKYKMIFKCLECKLAFHYNCDSSYKY